MSQSISTGWGWLGFWLFLTCLVWVEHSQFSAGYETFFFKHKTAEEIRLRDAAVLLREAEAQRASQKAKLL